MKSIGAFGGRRIQMIKLVVSDVDGTLVKDGTLEINPEYMDVIKKLRKKGVYFAVCSGRQYSSESQLFAPVKDQIFFVSDGGTLIRTSEKILKIHTLPDEIWKNMAKMVKTELPECDYFISGPDRCFAENSKSKMFRWLRDSYGYDIREVPDMMHLEGEQIMKIAVYNTERCEELCAPVFTPYWKDKINLAAAGKEWMDGTPLGADKRSAVAFLQEYLGISPEETCAFGDNINDIAMLKDSGFSYAVANAREEVRMAAKAVCPSYAEDGVLSVLKTLL